MNKDPDSDRSSAERRFGEIFAYFDFIAAYARHRGARDPDGIAAEAMAIAWRRLGDVPTNDPKPWLIVTARNLLLAERRRDPVSGRQPLGDMEIEAPADAPAFEFELPPELARALRVLSDKDREALLLVAWDDLTPAVAAASLGISATAFRVRLHRARRRLADLLSKQASERPVAPRPSTVSAQQPTWR